LEKGARQNARAIEKLIGLNRATIRLEPDDVERALRDARSELDLLVDALDVMRNIFDRQLPDLLKRAQDNREKATLSDQLVQLRERDEQQQRAIDELREQLLALHETIARLPRVVRSHA
jgi:predicted  nucleic acid-binding Zn-ribbon protein